MDLNYVPVQNYCVESLIPNVTVFNRDIKNKLRLIGKG